MGQELAMGLHPHIIFPKGCLEESQVLWEVHICAELQEFPCAKASYHSLGLLSCSMGSLCVIVYLCMFTRSINTEKDR